MRIFMLCADSGIPFDGTKGASVHLRSLSDAFHQLRHDVEVFVADPGSGSVPSWYGVHRLGAEALRDASATSAPDLVYERYALGHLDGFKWARENAVPFILEVNAPLVDEASAHRPWSVRPGDAEVERWLFRQADLVVAVSEPLRQYVAKVRGTSTGTVVVRNGCDPARFTTRARLSAGGPETLVFLGHPKPWHGAEELPRLVVELKRRGRDTRLLLIGGGPRAERILERSRAKGVADRVEVTGPVPPDEASRRLLEGTVAVAPYPPHPFFYFCPLKVMESMAAGLPVVTTAQGDISAIVGDAGIVVPPGDRVALAGAVEALLINERLRLELGARARERALSRFTWDHAARDVLRAAEGIAAARGRAA